MKLRKLLDQLDLKDKIVTGDAMFCQKSIVAKIAEKGGGYPQFDRRVIIDSPMA